MTADVPVTPRVIGLDLSLTATGIAGHDGLLHTVATARGGDVRLIYIRSAIHDKVLGGVDLAVVEDLPTHAKAAGITGMVHGVVRAVLLDVGVPYVLVPPATVKKYATGSGNATKADMRMALYQRTGDDVRDDNQVDAAWLRLMGRDALGVPEVEMPTTHRAVLAKVAWPEFAGSPPESPPESLPTPSRRSG